MSRAWLVLLSGSLFYFYQAVIRVSAGVVGPDLVAPFSVSEPPLGLFYSGFFFCFKIIKNTASLKKEKFGTRRLNLSFLRRLFFV